MAKDWLIAHRGAQKYAAENTIDAFKDATKLPVSYIELDIHTTKDGVVICNHDFKINNLDIDLYTYKELKKAKPDLTTFDEAIKAVDGKKPIIVEIKSAGTAKQVIKILEEHWDWPITTFNKEALQELIELGVDRKRIVFPQHWYYFNYGHIKKAKKLGASDISVKHWVITPRLYRRAVFNDLKICTYNVNSPLEAKIIRWLYPKMSIFTDRPDLLEELK